MDWDAIAPVDVSDSDDDQSRVDTNLRLGREISSDELAAKYDSARKRNLPTSLVMSLDNKDTDAVPSAWDMHPQATRFLAGDAYRASVFGAPEQIERLNKIGRVGDAFQVSKTYPDLMQRIVQLEIYGEKYRPNSPDRQRELLEAGYLPAPDNDMAYTRNDQPGKRFYHPILDSWVKAKQEEKIDSVYDAIRNFTRTVTSTGFALPYDGKTPPDADQKWNDIQAATDEHAQAYLDALRKFKVIAYLNNAAPNWRSTWSEYTDQEKKIAINLAGKQFGEDFSDLSPEDFDKAGMDKLRSPAVNLYAVSQVDDLSRKIDRQIYGVSAADIRDETKKLNQAVADAIGSTTSKQIADTVLQSIPYAAEIALTNGMAAIGKNAVIGAAENPSWIRRLGAMFAGEATRLPAFSGDIAAGVKSEFNVPTLTSEENGNFRLALQDNGLSLGEAILKHATLTYLSNFTEQTGEGMSEAVGKALGRVPVPYKERLGTLFASYAAENPRLAKAIADIQSTSKGVQKATHWDGLFGEQMEEELNQALNYAATQAGNMFGVNSLSSIDEDQPIMSWEDRGLSMGSIAAQSLGFNIPNAAYTLVSLRQLSRKRDAVLQMHDQLHPGNAPAESVAMAEDYIRQVLGNDGQITLGARQAAVLFQEQPDLLSALDLTDAEQEIINQKVADGGDIQLPLAKTMARINDHEQFKRLADLAENRPGGLTMDEFDPESIASKLKIKPEDIERIESGIRENNEYYTRLQEYATPLKETGMNAQERKASLGLLDAMITTFSTRAGIKPIDVLDQLKIRKIGMNDFLRGNDSRFHAVGDYFHQIKNALPEENGTAPLFSKKFRSVKEILPDLGRIFDSMPDSVIAADGSKLLVKNPERGSIANRLLHLIKSEDKNNAERNEYQPDKILWLPRLTETAINAQAKLEDPATGNLAYVRSYRDGGIHVVIVSKNGTILNQEQYDHGLITQFIEKYTSRRDGFKVVWENASKAQASDHTATAESSSGDAASLSDVIDIISDDREKVKNQDKKGAFDPSSGVISLFETADFSTFAHEIMHFFDDLYTKMAESGKIDDAQLLADIETIRQYSTTEDGKRDYERIAKAFENYLRKGEAPDPALKKLFRSIKEMLLKVYVLIRPEYFADEPVTNEIKSVFDRMLALDKQADNEMAGNELLQLLDHYDLLGLSKNDRKVAASILQSRKQQVSETLAKESDSRRKKVADAARKEAETLMRTIPVYRLWRYLDQRGKLDRNTVKRLFGNEVLARLRQRGAIAKTPRSERSGEKFYDRQQRRDKNIGLRKYRDAFEEYLYQNYPIIWALRDMRYEKIKPDEKFGISPEQMGSYLSNGSGTPSDVAAKEIASSMNDDSITEEKLIAALTGINARDLWRRFDQMRQDEKDYYDHQAESDLKLEATENLTAIASDNGYESVDKMISELSESPSPMEFKRMYEQQKLQEFDEAFPTSEYALDYAELVRQMDDMLRALSAQAGRENELASQSAYRKLIAGRVAKMSLQDVRRSDLTLGAIRRNSRAALTAMTKKDYHATYDAAMTARMQLELMRQMHKVQEESAKIVAIAKRMARYQPESSGKSKVQGDCLYWLQKLSSDYGIADSPLVPESKLSLDGLLQNFDSDLTSEQLPYLGQNEDYRNLTVEQFESLSELLGFLNTAGRELVKQADENRTGTAAAASKVIAENLKDRPEMPQYADGIGKWIKLRLNDFKLLGTNILAMCRAADNYDNALGRGQGGTAEQSIYNVLNEASSKEARLIHETGKLLNSSWTYLASRRKDFPKFIIEGMPPVPETIRINRKAQWDFNSMLAVALNCGNENNRRKLSEGYPELTQEAIDQILSKFDRKEDWDAIQNIWDAINKALLPEYQEAYKAANYIAMKEVEATPFEVKLADGKTLQVRGGYYPIKYDGKIDPDIGKRENEELKMSGYDGPRIVRSPDAGSSKSRKESTGKPILLDLSVLPRHIYEAAHYAAFKIPARQVGGILNNREFTRAMKMAFGENGYKEFNRMITNVVNPDRRNDSRVESYLRSVVTGMGLWGNLGSALMQYSSFTQGITTVGMENFIQAQKDYWRNPMRMTAMIEEKSQFMRDRQKGGDRDIRSKLNKVTDPEWKYRYNQVRDAGFIGIRVMDTAASGPMWLAGYETALQQGMSDADAVAMADKLIASTQGSGRNMEMTPIQLKPFMRLFAMFYSATSAFGTRQSTAYRAFRAGKIKHGQYAYFLALEAIGPAFLSGLLRIMASGPGGDDDKDKKRFWQIYWTEVMSYPVQGLPFLRDAIPELAGVAMTGQPSYGGKGGQVSIVRPLELASTASGDLARAISYDGDDQEKQDQYWGKASSEMAEEISALTGVPVVTAFKRIKKTIKHYTEE